MAAQLVAVVATQIAVAVVEDFELAIVLAAVAVLADFALATDLDKEDKSLVFATAVFPP